MKLRKKLTSAEFAKAYGQVDPMEAVMKVFGPKAADTQIDNEQDEKVA